MPIPNPAPRLTPEQIAKNMADIAPPMTSEEGYAEASRCLFCYDAPCTKACPTHINVPEFIKRISTRNVVGAAKTILEANLLGEAHLHRGATVGLNPLQLTAVTLHAAHRNPPHLSAIERLQYVVGLLRPHDANHEFHCPRLSIRARAYR